MDPWVFSDGTKVSLGGEVSGDSTFAVMLKVDISEIRTGKRRQSSFFGPTNDCVTLDLDVPYLLDSWLAGVRPGYVKLVSYPEFETPLLEPGEVTPGQTIY
jgi:hypothetical protein